MQKLYYLETESFISDWIDSARLMLFKKLMRIIIMYYQEYYNKLIILLRFYLMLGLDMVLLWKIYLSGYWRAFMQWLNPPCKISDNDKFYITNAKLFIGDYSHQDITGKLRQLADTNQWITWPNLKQELAITDTDDPVEILISYKIPDDDEIYKITYINFEHPGIHLEQHIQKNSETTCDGHRIFYAELPDSGTDITNLIRAYSGPNQDFYSCNGHHMTVGLIRNENGNRICIEEDLIHIIDDKMRLHQFNHADVIKFLQ